MIERYYNIILFATAVLLYFMGSYFMFGRIPNKKIFESYKFSRSTLGFALVIWATQIIILWKFKFRITEPFLASSLNLITYYACALLFGLAYINLLNNRIITQKRIISHLIPYATTVILIIVANIIHQEKWRQTILIVAALIFFVNVIRLSFLFIQTYRRTLHKIENYYSDNIDIYVKWISKSAYFVISFGLLGAIMAFAPIWLITLYCLGGMLVFTYIFFAFQNYLIHFEEIQLGIDEPDILETDLYKNTQPTENACFLPDTDSATQQNLIIQSKIDLQIEKELNKWIQQKGYTEEGITLGSLSETIHTNRTYLSSFINKTYDCTFRVWINYMRIQESKKLLLNKPKSSIEDISHEVGFASSSHFIRIFSENEHHTPAEWRRINNLIS